MSAQPEVQVRIGTLRVTAASAVEARRLADALPTALERALRAPVTSTSRDRVERVAVEVAAAIRAHLGEAGDRR